MNSFFVPALGGQVFAMAGMQTRLHLAADGPGRFTGRNTQYSGEGFADQKFQAVAMAPGDFDAWVGKAKLSARLNAAAYTRLARPSIAHPVEYFSDPDPGLFDAVIGKYAHPVPPRLGGRLQ
jgi:cytochrome o ubiquinol oxidase subunit 2